MQHLRLPPCKHITFRRGPDYLGNANRIFNLLATLYFCRTYIKYIDMGFSLMMLARDPKIAPTTSSSLADCLTPSGGQDPSAKSSCLQHGQPQHPGQQPWRIRRSGCGRKGKNFKGGASVLLIAISSFMEMFGSPRRLLKLT